MSQFCQIYIYVIVIIINFGLLFIKFLFVSMGIYQSYDNKQKQIKKYINKKRRIDQFYFNLTNEITYL